MKQLLAKLLSYLPSKLPIGMQEFETWANDIIQLVDKGMANVPVNDLKFTLAAMIMHLGATVKYKPKAYFVACLHKTAANQVAGQVFQDIKTQQKQAAEAAKAGESTTAEQPGMVSSNGETKTT